MSQLWIYIKTNIRALVKQGPMVIAMYVILPIFFSLLMGFSFSSLFVPEEISKPIEVTINNLDQGEQGQQLVDVLQSEAMQSYIEIVEDSEDADFTINIQADYSQKPNETLLEVEAKDNVSSTEETILVQLLTDYQNTYVNQQGLAKKLATINDQAVAEQLLTSLEQVVQLSIQTVFEKQSYQSQTSLTGNQFTSVSGLIYIFILALGGSVGMKTKEEMKGLRKRIGVLPLSPAQDTLYGLTSDTITFTTLGAIYMVVWHLIDSQTFRGNPLFYLAWLAIYAFLFQAINSALFHLIPDKYASLVYQLFTTVFMLFGFMPLDRLLGEKYQAFFSANYYRELFSDPMYDYMISQQWQGHLGQAFGIIIVGIILVGGIILIRTRRELKAA